MGRGRGHRSTARSQHLASRLEARNYLNMTFRTLEPRRARGLTKEISFRKYRELFCRRRVSDSHGLNADPSTLRVIRMRMTHFARDDKDECSRLLRKSVICQSSGLLLWWLSRSAWRAALVLLLFLLLLLLLLQFAQQLLRCLDHWLALLLIGLIRLLLLFL